MKIETLKELIHGHGYAAIIWAFNETIVGLNGQDDYIYNMSDFDEINTAYTPYEVAERICYGNGFNPQHPFFVIDVYNHFKSLNAAAVTAYIEDRIHGIYLFSYFISKIDEYENGADRLI